MKIKAAFQFLYQYKAIQFIKENYEIEHTLSFEDVVEDMLLICEKILMFSPFSAINSY